MNTKYLLLSIFVVCMAACDSSDTDPTAMRYLPLQVGNYWNLEHLISTDVTYTNHREVTGEVSINNESYYVMVQTVTTGNNVWKDTAYYRVKPNGYVYVLPAYPHGREINEFRLGGADKDSWKVDVENEVEATIRLSQTTVTIGNDTIADCKQYDYDVAQMADEEHGTVLAAGIGFVKVYGAWSPVQVLRSARINGEMMEFGN